MTPVERVIRAFNLMAQGSETVPGSDPEAFVVRSADVEELRQAVNALPGDAFVNEDKEGQS